MLQSGRAYHIINKASGTWLDRTSDDAIIIHPYNGGGLNQRWIAFRNGPYWTLQNQTGGYLTTSDFRHPEGLTLSTGITRAGWELRNTEGNNYEIRLWTSVNNPPVFALEPQALPRTSAAHTGLGVPRGDEVIVTAVVSRFIPRICSILYEVTIPWPSFQNIVDFGDTEVVESGEGVRGAGQAPGALLAREQFVREKLEENPPKK
ncbi:hypothetical protein DFH07DRAFT_782320 [Mycena maculata]|uniref:Ricin B lectin domain-containing protein n=1 Tax=Mycena maculata TaxID=230809 RepID=A0AAD7HTJ5_9AGAR|nr:hypothetical protein DFH07DRAFT_782320 [Mycena maculata]